VILVPRATPSPAEQNARLVCPRHRLSVKAEIQEQSIHTSYHWKMTNDHPTPAR